MFAKSTRTTGCWINRLSEKFFLNSQVLKSQYLNRLVSAFKTKKFREDYNEPHARILRVLYLLSQNPVDLGKLMKTPILALDDESQKEKPALLNDEFIKYLENQQASKGYVAAPLQFSDTSEDEEETQEVEKTEEKKEAPQPSKNETKRVSFPIIGVKRIRSREEKASMSDSTKIEESQEKLFKDFDPVISFTLDHRLEIASDVLNDSTYFQQTISRLSDPKLLKLNEPQVIYNLTQAVSGLPNPLVKVMQTNINDFECVFEQEFSLQNLAQGTTRTILIKFLSLIQIHQELLALNQLKLKSTGKLTERFQVCLADILHQFETEFTFIQKELVFQTMVRPQMASVFLGKEFHSEMQNRSITLLNLSKKVEEWTRMFKFLKSIHSTLSKTQATSSLRTVLLLNLLERAFLDSDRLFFGTKNQQMIEKLFVDLSRFWFEELENDLFSSQKLDFSAFQRFSSHPHVDKMMLLNSYFSEVCLLDPKKFPAFMKKTIVKLFHLICAHYVNAKLTEKFLIQADIDYKFKNRIELMPSFLGDNSNGNPKDQLAFNPSVSGMNFKEFMRLKKETKNKVISAGTNFMPNHRGMIEGNGPFPTNLGNPRSQQNLLNIEGQGNLARTNLSQGFLGKATNSELNIFIQMTSKLCINSNVQNMELKQQMLTDKQDDSQSEVVVQPTIVLETGKKDEPLKQKYDRFVDLELPDIISRNLQSLDSSINDFMMNHLYLVQTFNFFEQLFLFGQNNRKTDEILNHLYESVR